MQEQNYTNCFTIYVLLFISAMFLFVDIFEFYRIITQWKEALKINPITFEKCYEYPLLVNTLFSFFSTAASVSALSLTIFMTVNFSYFIEKIASTFLYFNFLIFGPYMLAFSVIGLYYYDKVFYTCDKDLNGLHFNTEMVFNLSGCMGFSIIVTLCVAIYECAVLYINSILRKAEGSKMLSNMFWWVVQRSMNRSYISN
jgi:hypothetical protein